MESVPAVWIIDGGVAVEDDGAADVIDDAGKVYYPVTCIHCDDISHHQHFSPVPSCA
jgi:hypothetical protein